MPLAREVWFDPRHTGALRILDPNTHRIHGTDPREPRWSVDYEPLSDGRIRVNFASKATHHGARTMIAQYAERRRTIEWPDGNRWRRVCVDPGPLLARYPSTPAKRSRSPHAHV